MGDAPGGSWGRDEGGPGGGHGMSAAGWRRRRRGRAGTEGFKGQPTAGGTAHHAAGIRPAWLLPNHATARSVDDLPIASPKRWVRDQQHAAATSHPVGGPVSSSALLHGDDGLTRDQHKTRICCVSAFIHTESVFI